MTDSSVSGSLAIAPRSFDSLSSLGTQAAVKIQCVGLMTAIYSNPWRR